MSRRLYTSVRILLLGAIFSLGAFAEDHYLIKATGDVNALAKRHGLKVVKALGGSATGHYVVSSTGINPQTVLHNLANDNTVQKAEADRPVSLPGIKPASTVVHPAVSRQHLSFSSTLVKYHNSYVASGYRDQPAVGVINLVKGQTLATGAGIVATIDTGADFTHPGLRGTLIPGWDFVHNAPLGQELADVNQETTPILDQETTPILDQETTPILDGGAAVVLTQETTPILDQETTPILDGKKYPAFGHGTMVASLIHLVAPDAKIMPLRAFGANGSATISQIVAAIHFAVDRDVSVVNMSFSVSQDSDMLSDAMHYATSKGLILVASAGNNNSSVNVWPAAYSNVIGVAATDDSYIRAGFSNFGSPLVSLAAPGVNIIAMYPLNHYALVSGTSFSCPLVTGTAALLVDLNKKINQATVETALSHAKKLASGQGMGAGELDVYLALTSLSKKSDENKDDN